MASRRHKLIAFLPATVVIGIVAVTASGLSIIPGAGAASDIIVSGTVAGGMSLDPDTASACGGTDNTVGVGDFSDGAFHGGDATCTVTFATNAVNGANVTIDDADAAPFFCTGACTAASNLSVENAGTASAAALGDDEFGVALAAVAGTPTPVAGSTFALDATSGSQGAAEAIWGGIDAAPRNICETNAVTTVDQSCSLAFGVDGQGATQTAGTYTGTANVLASAKP